VPLTSGVELASGLPPLAAAYHLIELPVATKLATVGLLLTQNDCEALPVGAEGSAVTVITVATDVAVLADGQASADGVSTTVIKSPLANVLLV
jgi:hypothetical protein